MGQAKAGVGANARTSRRTLLVQAAGAGAAALLTGYSTGQAQAADERGAAPAIPAAQAKPATPAAPATPAVSASPGATTAKGEKILARCGYRCDLCAARSDDPTVRQKLVDGWRKYYGHTQYTVENVKCGGCSAEKRADMTCGVRPCAIAKGLETCAECKECPCKKLVPLCSSPHINFLRFPNASQEDYDLCLRQFDNIPELMEIRARQKKKG
jgi:hypothetical protein